MSNEIILVRPSLEYASEIMDFRREMMAAGDSDHFAGCSGLEKYDSSETWLCSLVCMENPQTCPPGFVTSSVYLALRKEDRRLVGITDLRHHINHPILGLWGGHIGYSIRPSERKKGYGREMLRLNLLNCKARGMDKVMVTCSSNNIASEKIIVANGGVFEKEVNVDGEVIKRYWISL